MISNGIPASLHDDWNSAAASTAPGEGGVCDKQLYRANQSGRNRAEFEPAAVSQVSAEEKGLLFAAPGTA